jgi:hypothetical protein
MRGATPSDFQARCALLLERGKKPEVPEVIGLVREFYALDGNGVGGVLHVVLDDCNIEDGIVDSCIGSAIASDDRDGWAMACVLRMMSKTQRLKIVHLAGCAPGSSSG